MLGGRPPDGIIVPSWPVMKQGSKGDRPHEGYHIGLDIAKSVFQVHGEDRPARSCFRSVCGVVQEWWHVQPAAALLDRYRGLRHGAPLGADAAGGEARRAADPGGLCEALRAA